MFYTTILFSSQSPVALLLLFTLIIGVITFLRLPLRGRAITSLLVLLMLLVVFTSSEDQWYGHLALVASKIFCLSMIVALFTMTTKLSSILQLLLPSKAVQSRLYPLAYIINTILAVLPSIQYDLQRAIDSETVRRGQKVNFYSLGSWFTILTVILVRVLNRAERFTDTVIDRGYIPSQGLNPLISHSLKWRDVLLALFVVAPGVLIWIIVS